MENRDERLDKFFEEGKNIIKIQWSEGRVEWIVESKMVPLSSVTNEWVLSLDCVQKDLMMSRMDVSDKQ